MFVPELDEAALSKKYTPEEVARIKVIYNELWETHIAREERKQAALEATFTLLTYKSLAQNYKHLSAKACFKEVKNFIKHLNKKGGKKIVIVNLPGTIITDTNGDKYLINKHGDSIRI